MLFAESKLFQGFQMEIGHTLVYALIGIVGVFLVLAVLIGLLYLFQTIFKFNVIDKIAAVFKKKKNASAEENKDAAVEFVFSDDDELIAVISAAICAVYESESGEVPPFVIRNIKRK